MKENERIQIKYEYVVEISYHAFKFPDAFTASRFMSEAVRGTLRTKDYHISSMGYIGDICMRPIVVEDEEEEEDGEPGAGEEISDDV